MTTDNQPKKINIEVIGGLILFAAAVAAIIISNSSLAHYYDFLETTKATLSIGQFAISKNLVHWINDGLMVAYFLLVGLEIKREFVGGILASKANIIIPAVVAFFGLAIPSLIYALININHPEYIKGWAIPAATDIAFTLGILALLGPRVPTSLKILVTTIAIFDDIAAIIIIAIFYTQDLSLASLFLAGCCLIIMILLNRLGIKNLSMYMVVGAIMWVCVLKSGVHATLAGVATAMCIPHSDKEDEKSPLVALEHALNPWIIFVTLPLFAFANAGVRFEGFSADMIFNPISLGIILGLFIGKQIGIFSSLYLFSKTRFFELGKRLSLMQFYGIGLVCGIGFTMSLFIGSLAFSSSENLNFVRIGVLAGSLLSGVAGYIVLRLAHKKSQNVNRHGLFNNQ